MLTTRQFLDLLTRSKLVAPDVVASLNGDDPQAIAASLVSRRLLTRWQAHQLLSGRTQFQFGKYMLLEKLGEGGMGAVYTAQQTNIDRVVALKIMSPSIAAQRSLADRFLREVQAMGRLRHPNIVTAYDADHRDGVLYLVMEYVPAHDLSHWITRHGQLPFDWACECIFQAAVGLQHAFEQGIVHRDIKPANLLILGASLTELPQVKILDLGLARLSGQPGEHTELTRTGEVMGTPLYMAPEQALDGKLVDIRADIYSLGCTLFKMLTGDVPFAGDSALEILMARARNPPPSLVTQRPDVPPALNSVTRKMLSTDPNDRYQTPAQVAHAIAPFALGKHSNLPDDSLPTIAIDTGQAETGKPALVGRAMAPRIVWIAACVTVAIVLLIAVYIWWPRRHREGDQSPTRPELYLRSASVSLNWPVRSGGRLIVDGKPVAGDRLSLEPGQHRLVLRYAGYPDLERVLSLEGTDQTVSLPWPTDGPFDSEQARDHQRRWSEYLGVPEQKTNSIGMKFALIPPGEFEMGETGQAHSVRLTQPFYLGVHEVTQGQYEQVIGTNPARFKNPNSPVESVSWHDAIAFCNALSEREKLVPYYRVNSGESEAIAIVGGSGYRLPTEAQWEYGCRAGSTTTWYFGNEEARLAMHAWYDVNSEEHTRAVGEKQANSFGLYDMSGNVWELCFDWHADYPNFPMVDPLGPPRGSDRVRRGGSWTNDARGCRSASRYSFGPGHRSSNIGFRVLTADHEPAG